MSYKFILTFAFIATAISLVADSASAAESTDPGQLAAYVNDDTFAVAQFNLSILPKEPGSVGAIIKSVPFLSDQPQAATIAAALEQFIAALRSVGVEAVNVAVGLSDLNENGGPILILRTGPGGDTKKLVQMLGPSGKSPFPRISNLAVEAKDTNTVFVGSATNVKRYAELKSSPRPDLLSPLAKLSEEDAFAAAVFCPGPDFRRVVRELWPQLPGPLAPLKGELADEWLHLELAVNLPPNSKPRVTLQATDAASAETFVKLLQALPDAIQQFGDLGEREHVLPQQVQTVLDVLPPRQEGARVTLTLPSDDVQLTKLKPLVAEVFHSTMESSWRDKRVNQFRQITIAMNNYHDVNKHLPASAAIRSANGDPLLSWRVAILPYMDQKALYEQFHLDEPWDSPHNRKLIEKMPAVFADPDPKLKYLAREGKTTYQVPVAPETIFYKDEGTPFREVTDGTSKTIVLVEVEPLRAVVWSKPEDWKVDMQNPLRGVRHNERSKFIAGFADSHVLVIPVDADWGKFRGFLTRSGGELFDWP